MKFSLFFLQLKKKKKKKTLFILHPWAYFRTRACQRKASYYENLPMQYTEIFSEENKMKHLLGKK